MKSIFSFLALFVAISYSSWAGAYDILGTSIITIDIDSSRNRDVEARFDKKLILPIGSSLEYFELEFTDFNTDPSIGFPDFARISFVHPQPPYPWEYWNAEVVFDNQFSEIYIGQIVAVPGNPEAYTQYAFDNLSGLVQGSSIPTPDLWGAFGWHDTSINAGDTPELDGTIMTVELRAMGTLAPIPEPATYAMIIGGLGTVLIRMRLR